MIYMGLVDLPKNKVLQNELTNLIDTGKKIDHPSVMKDGTIGSKDTADSVCNAVFNLFQDLKNADKISGRFNNSYPS
jgi:hypothetical protein